MDRASERTRTWRDCGACSASRTTPDATQYSSVFMNQEPDIAIVGAGAAGIGVARRLARSGLSTVVLEALPRLGGRAWTRQAAGVSLDLGCGWLHSADRNPWIGPALPRKRASRSIAERPHGERNIAILAFLPQSAKRRVMRLPVGTSALSPCRRPATAPPTSCWRPTPGGRLISRR